MSTSTNEDRQKHIELMRAMGAPEFDPTPPDHYLFRLDPRMKLSIAAHQLHAWLLWMTIHSKPGGRTHYAAWGERALGLSDGADDLNYDLPAISKAWKELVSKGIARRDEEGRLCPCGLIHYHKPKSQKTNENGEGEEMGKLSVQTTTPFLLPAYVKRRLEEVDEPERERFLTIQQRIDQAEDEAIAEATAQVRERFLPVRTAHFATIGVKRVELPKWRDKNQRREPQLKVALQLELPQFDFVQTPENGLSVQNGNGSLYTGKSESVQTAHPYKTQVSQHHRKSSSSSSTSSAPVQNSTTTKPSQEELEAVEQLSAAVQANGDTPDAAFLLNLFRDARKKDPSVVPAEIVQIMHERAKAKRAPGLEFYRVVVLNCLPLRRVMSAAADEERPESLEEKIRQREQMLAHFENEVPNHAQIPQLKRELETLRNELAAQTQAENKPGAQAQKAGQR